jgi:hypothetical protein
VYEVDRWVAGCPKVWVCRVHEVWIVDARWYEKVVRMECHGVGEDPLKIAIVRDDEHPAIRNRRDDLGNAGHIVVHNNGTLSEVETRNV